jgi:1-acyl-sn-glycerol-3-phosphate acyltransferase
MLLSWLFTPLFLLAFAIVMVGFDPLLRLSRLFGRRPEDVMGALLQWSAMQSLRVAGTRFAVERSSGLRPRQGYIVVSNHQSIFDIAILGGLLLTNFPKYVAKKELARGLPSVSFHLREGGNAIIDRESRGRAVIAIRELGLRAEERGVSAVIYPEGTRARDGTLKPWKVAGLLALLEAAPNLPVVPVAIDESWKLVRHRFWPVPFGTRVRVHLGTPIPRSPDEDRAALIRRAEEEVRSTLERWRGAPPAGDLGASAPGASGHPGARDPAVS